MELRGRNVVITGGSQGIGAEFAVAFADVGANVLVVARSEDKLKLVAERVDGDHLVADLTDPDEVSALIPACIERLGHIDVLVNNAGVETKDAFVNVPEDDLRRLARLNFEAPLILTHAAARHMLGRGANGEGHIVQVSSVAGAMPFPGLTAYAGSKAGVTHFTETLRLELARTGVELTVVAPGPVDTDMWERLEEDSPYAAPALRRFRQMASLPMISTDKLAKATVKAVQEGKRHVRLPLRYGLFHMLSNAPARLAEAALTGVDLTPTLDKELTG